jgi:CRISPR/Cas system-associated exonuclease Cas4 (RecB family)
MTKYYANIKPDLGVITHEDQEVSGLQFEYITGYILAIEAPNQNTVDAWATRVGVTLITQVEAQAEVDKLCEGVKDLSGNPLIITLS